jgi:hypothetical protein
MDLVAAELVTVTLRRGDEEIIVRVVVSEPPEKNTPQPRTSWVERRFAEALEASK